MFESLQRQVCQQKISLGSIYILLRKTWLSVVPAHHQSSRPRRLGYLSQHGARVKAPAAKEGA